MSQRECVLGTEGRREKNTSGRGSGEQFLGKATSKLNFKRMDRSPSETRRLGQAGGPPTGEGPEGKVEWDQMLPECPRVRGTWALHTLPPSPRRGGGSEGSGSLPGSHSQ